VGKGHIRDLARVEITKKRLVAKTTDTGRYRGYYHKKRLIILQSLMSNLFREFGSRQCHSSICTVFNIILFSEAKLLKRIEENYGLPIPRVVVKSF
jgi:hypothetical protein